MVPDGQSRSGPGRVLVDGLNLALPQGTGVATYARNLAAALGRLGLETEGLYALGAPDRADPLLREIALIDPPAPRRPPFNYARTVVRVASSIVVGARAREVVMTGRVQADPARRPPFGRVWAAYKLWNLAQDVFDVTGRRLRVHVPDPPAVTHWTYPLPVEVVGSRNIYTLHDLVPLRLPQTTLDRKDRYLRLMRLLAREADHLVTVSEASRRDILELLHVAPERVTNTYQSAYVADAPTPREARALVAGALGRKPGGYHLFFGAIEPKKNVGRLLEAFLLSEVERPLVLVGKAAWKADEELRLLPGALESGRVIRLDYAPAGLLRALVRCARTVVFPSLSEGFGLPVLEAMALGAPVITSTAAALPEVAGDAAVLVDPYDVRALAAALRALDGDDARCAELAARGPAQAARFSEAAYDARLRELYRSLGAPV